MQKKGKRRKEKKNRKEKVQKRKKERKKERERDESIYPPAHIPTMTKIEKADPQAFLRQLLEEKKTS